MIVYENPWFKVIKQDRYHYIEEVNSLAGAAILTLRGEFLLLLEMYRLAQDGHKTLEIPRGYADNGETSLQCAQRELLEETGYRVDASQLHLLGYIRPNTALLRTRVAIYFTIIDENIEAIARDDEAKALVSIPIKDIDRYLMEGQLEDSFTLAALCYLKFKET